MALSKTKAIGIWTGLTVLLWGAYLALRLTIGGTCPGVELQADFDRERYLGRWYEQFRHYDVPYEVADCATATYSTMPLNQFEIDNVEWDLVNEEWPRDEFPLGKGIVSGFTSGLANVKFFPLAPWANYMVLETDYDNYSIVYNCDAFSGGMVKVEYLWVLSRTPYEIDSADWVTFRDERFATIREKVGDYIDPDTDLRPTQ